ncbi:tubulin epsilon and delta complex protein 1 isoform 1-T1 [Discoglossus pictus]
MKRGGSGQLKEILSALCRALAVTGGNPSPETFRKAKFNRPEATPEFWKLLYLLLKQIYQRKNGSSVSTDEKEMIENQIRFVKSVLWDQGYGRAAVYHLPLDATEGSRELLLAFSWLLSRMKPLEKILEMNRIKVGDEMTVCTCLQGLGLKANEDASPPVKVDVRYLQWLHGKMRFSWRTRYAAQQEKCSLLYKIHLYTHGCHVDPDIKHLSLMETDLVRQPEKYTKVLQSLESESTHLEAYLEWKQLEPVYWQWMESVLESCVEDDEIVSSQGVDNGKMSLPDGLQQWRNNLNSDIDKMNKDLVELHNQLQELVSCKKTLWDEQAKEMEKRISEKEFSLMVKKVKQDVRKKTEAVHRPVAQTRQMHGPLRVAFQKGILSGSNSRGVRTTELIMQLEKSRVNLEEELHRLQGECRCIMDEIAERLEGVICIPPAKK